MIAEYYTHQFVQEEGITAANFLTNSGTKYRVYFYPAKDYFDYIEEGSIIYLYGFYFGFTKIFPNEDKKEKFDPRVRNTIVNIIIEFYESQGSNSILIFQCSDDWGKDKKFKRSKRFNEWFLSSEYASKFHKKDEIIIVHNYLEDGTIETDKEYLSLISEIDHEFLDEALEEFQQIRDTLSVMGKR